ncbi:hypothetical protein ABN028_23260 [Actinopolymorpha sp. B17G11]|uniref:hypothetical protein n=1 Tax=Actinopolymorpha sp. B17G11 TaxID=3160861 RepID=UPI0032E441B1
MVTIVLTCLAVVMFGVLALLGRSAGWRRRAGGVSWWLRIIALGYVVVMTVVAGLALMGGTVDLGVGVVGTAVVLGTPVVVTVLAVATSLLPTALHVPVLWTIAVLALAGVVITGLSVGLFYSPAALCLLAAAFAAGQATPVRGGRSPEPSYDHDG